jgi:hypothetical protein
MHSNEYNLPDVFEKEVQSYNLAVKLEEKQCINSKIN